MQKNTAPLALSMILVACGGGDAEKTERPTSNVPGTELFLEAPDGKYHGPLSRLELRPSELSLEVGEQKPFEAFGFFEDGTEIELAGQVYWEGSNGEIAALGNLEDKKVSVHGIAEGESSVRIVLGTVEVTAKVTVLPATLRTLEISTDLTVIPRGTSQRLTAMGTYGDGRTEDLTALATWSSDNEAILSVGTGEKQGGLARGVANGEATITAQIDDLTATASFSVACVYPDGPSNVRDNAVLPAMSWENAYMPGGARGDFSLESYFCDDDTYGDDIGILFLISAGWCPSCPQYIRRIDSLRSSIESRGGSIVFVEAETASYTSANHEYAQDHFNSLIGATTGIRVGDAETNPSRDFIRSSPIVTAFPTVFVVRRRDMKVMANQSNSPYVLPILEIFDKIDWDWSDPQNPVPGFAPNCSEDEEEQFEPNNTAQEAAVVGATVVEGGICGENADFYKIDIEGPWRVTLQFDNDVGNLDIVVWNEATNRPLQLGGEYVGSTSTTDNEVFESEGRKMIRVAGADNASAPYTMFIEAL